MLHLMELDRLRDLSWPALSLILCEILPLIFFATLFYYFQIVLYLG